MENVPQSHPAGRPPKGPASRYVVRPSPEVLSEFRRRAARRDPSLDDGSVAADPSTEFPELTWFAEGILAGLWGDDGLRVVSGVRAGLGRRDWVDAFHRCLAHVLRRLAMAMALPPARGPLVGRLCTASPPRGFEVLLHPAPGLQGLGISAAIPRRIVIEAGDAVWCDGARCALGSAGAREL